jgi:hypothetical protein
MRPRRSPDPLCGTILWREFGAAYDLGFFSVGPSYTSAVSVAGPKTTSTL